MRFEHFPFTFRSIRIRMQTHLHVFEEKQEEEKGQRTYPCSTPKKPKDSEDDEAS